MSKLDLRYVLYYLLLSAPCLGEEAVFPHKMPDRKPDMELSSAMQRMYRYPAPRVQDNEPSSCILFATGVKKTT